jgi:N-acyl-D-amino-acid deacylase
VSAARSAVASSAAVTSFDLILRGGLVVDGSGAPGRPADVGVLGDRILAVGDLPSVADGEAATILDVADRVVTPGFIDPHGHSDGSLFVDGALISHLAQGFTTQLSGNCGDTLAPITDRGRELVELSLRPNQLVARWRTFAEFLEAVDEVSLGPNVAFLVGHGTVRGSVVGPEGRPADDLERRSMVREVEAAMDAGAFGLSSGLIYAPGIHATPDEVATLATAATRRGGLYATHMRDETRGLFDALEASIAAVRAAAAAGVEAPRLQVSHLKCGARAVWGRAAEAIAVLERAQAEGLDVAADQYPYTAAATTLATVLPPALLALGVDACIAALSDLDIRDRIRSEMARGISGWENVASDPGWAGIVISSAAAHPDWSGRSLADLGASLGKDPSDVAFDALIDDRLDVQVVIHCMDPEDVATIAAVPWIAVCTDAEGRRPGHPILDAGVPHPRTYGSTARVLGDFVRERGVLSLETAVAKLTSVPAARLGLRDRGIVREGAVADLVVVDPATVADRATYEVPSVHPAGIDHVVVNGRLAMRDGAETGVRAGRLLRHAG